MVPEWMDDKWVAAFFDGEGCIHSQITKSGRVVPRVTIGQKRSNVLDILHEYLELGGIRPNGGSRVLGVHSRQEVIEFIRRVYPYSIVKRSQLRVAFEIFKASKPDAIALHFKLQELKRTG